MKKKIDSLGRIGIPKVIREQMELKADDPILIDFDPHNKTITIKKAENRCFVCGASKELFLLPDCHYLCRACLRQTEPSLTSDTFKQ